MSAIAYAAQSVGPLQFQAAIDTAWSRDFAGVIAIGDVRRELYSAAIGLADRERAIAHRTDERWLWASVSKQVTAVLVMSEVARSRLALDTAVSTLLRSFARAGHRAVTVCQLLQHTSGLPNLDETEEGPDGVPAFYRQTGPGISQTACASGFCASPAKTAPGVAFASNNCDYLVGRHPRNVDPADFRGPDRGTPHQSRFPPIAAAGARSTGRTVRRGRLRREGPPP